MPSPFLHPGPVAHADSLAILHLRRDSLIPTRLQDRDDTDHGYDEGIVTNTRFGSYPHSTLINRPWGTQVLASAVDTGSRGRRNPEDSLKRKAALAEGALHPKAPVAASSGFAHLLPPTAETWTTSLPHRTQVVYTPDYSYVLQRLRVRPGTVIIEAGAGSGSFTHAAARAVFSGYGGHDRQHPSKKRKVGNVFSFEFHEQRAVKLRSEIKEHGLDDIVHITHRDVYNEGFLHPNLNASEDGEGESESRANAVFLDLPAPWLALKHLKRAIPKPKLPSGPDPESTAFPKTSYLTPLDPTSTVHICTFSPCLEQVQKTVSELRNQGWLEIEMVEIAQRRIEVRRERVGLHEEGLRGVNPSAATVEEAVARLKEVESSTKEFHENANANGAANFEIVGDQADGMSIDGLTITPPSGAPTNMTSKQQRLESIKDALAERKIFKEGRLIHRSEPELKTHTSYLVFAILPREWTEEDEKACRAKWPSRVEVNFKDAAKSRRQLKREAKRKGEGEGKLANGHGGRGD